MPNWITTKIKAPTKVIAAMLNADGQVDFSVTAPFPGPNNQWDGILVDAEILAEEVCCAPVPSNPLVDSLRALSRSTIDIRKMRDESFTQFIGMVENYRACGYLHSMDFARKVWGTKWNACEPKANPEEGTASFETAWSCPEGVLVELSKRFPEETIEVIFADEDIGSNCGKFTLKAGQKLDEDIAPGWDEMTAEQKAKWQAFAYEVKGWTPEPDDEEQS